MINITICKESHGYVRERIKTIHIDTQVPLNKLIQFMIAISGYQEKDIFSISLYMDFDRHDNHLMKINHDHFNKVSNRNFDQVLRENITARNVLSLFCTISIHFDAQPKFEWPHPHRMLVVKPEQMSSNYLPAFLQDDNDNKIVATVYELCMAQKHQQMLEQNVQIADKQMLKVKYKIRITEIKLQIAEPDQKKTKQRLRILEEELRVQNRELQQLKKVVQEKQKILRGMQQTSQGIQILESLLRIEQLTAPEEQNNLLLPPQPLSRDQEKLIPPAATISPALPLTVSSSLSPAPQNRSTRWALAAQRINELLMTYHYQYYFDVIVCINLNRQRYEDAVHILRSEKIDSDKYDDDLEFVEHVLFKIAAAYPKLRDHFSFEYCATGKYWGEQLNYLVMCLTPGGLMFSPLEVKEQHINKLLISGNPGTEYMSKNITVLATILRLTRELAFDINILDDEFLNALCAAREKCGDSYGVTSINFKGACSVEQLERLLTFVSGIKLFSPSCQIEVALDIYPLANTKFPESATYNLKVRESRRSEERFVTIHGDIDDASRMALLDALPKSNKTTWDVKVIVAKRTLSLGASEQSPQNVLGHFSQYLVPTKCTRLLIEELPLIKIDVNSQRRSTDVDAVEANGMQRLSGVEFVADQSKEKIIVSVSLRKSVDPVLSECLPQPHDLINALTRMGLREIGILHLRDITVNQEDFALLMKYMTSHHELYVEAPAVDSFVCNAKTNVDQPICYFTSDDMSIPIETSSGVRNYLYRQPSFVNDYLFHAISHLPAALEKRVGISHRGYRIYQNLLDLLLKVNVTSLFISAQMAPVALTEFTRALRLNHTMIKLEINGDSISEETRQIIARNKRLADVTAAARKLPAQLAAVEKILDENSPKIIKKDPRDILPQIIRLMDVFRDCVSAAHEAENCISEFFIFYYHLIIELNSHGKSLENILQRCVAIVRLRRTIFATEDHSSLAKCLHKLIIFNKAQEQFNFVFMPLLQKQQSHLYEQQILPLRNRWDSTSSILSSWIIAGCELYFICTPSLHKDNITLALDLTENVLELNSQIGMRMLKHCAVNYATYFRGSGDDTTFRLKEAVQPFYRMQRLMSGKLHDKSPLEDILVVLKMITTLLRYHFLPIVRGEYEGSLSAMGFGTGMDPEVLKIRLVNVQNNPTQLLNIISDILKFNDSLLGFEQPAYFKALEEMHKSLRHIQTITQPQGGWVFGYVSVAEETNAETTNGSRVQSKIHSNSASTRASEIPRKTTDEVEAAPQKSKGKQHAEGDAENHQTVVQVPTRHNYAEDKKIYTELSSSGRLSGPTLFNISAVFYSSVLTSKIMRERKERYEKEHRSAIALTGSAPEQAVSSSWFGNEQEFETAARSLARCPTKRRVQ